MLFSLLLLTAQISEDAPIARAPDGSVVIVTEIASDAPDPALLERDEDGDLREVDEERETRRAFEEAIDAARSAMPF